MRRASPAWRLRTPPARRLRAYSAGAFSPASLPGLALWLTASPSYCFQDAAATVPCGDGDAVYTWVDRSGNGNDLVQATASSRPILFSLGGGLWCVTFDGVDDSMAATFTLNQPVTAALVGAIRTAGAAILDGVGDFTMVFRSNDGTQWSMYAGATIAGGSADTSTHQLTAVFDGASSVLRADGGQVAAGDAGSSNPGGVTLGQAHDGSRVADGDVMEVIVVAGTLSASNRSSLESYLKNAWGTP